MQLSLLSKLFKNQVSITEFKSAIEIEVEGYGERLKIKGGSVPINIDEDCSLYFTKDNLIQLCEYYLNGSIDSLYVSYLADCLTLAEEVIFEDEEVAEILEEMTDPSVNGALTKERVVSFIDLLD